MRGLRKTVPVPNWDVRNEQETGTQRVRVRLSRYRIGSSKAQRRLTAPEELQEGIRMAQGGVEFAFLAGYGSPGAQKSELAQHELWC